LTEYHLLGFSSIIILGILAQWLAWRLGLPSILVLLIFGFLAGPISGFIQPDVIFGELLFPSVSLAVALMGILLANQKSVNIKHIAEFKENLGVLLLSSLFIVLAARLQMSDISQLGWNSLAFLAVMIFIVRPACILVSTLGSDLSWKEILFLSWLAPRGIVAAAVTAVFALELSQVAGYEDAGKLVPEMFLIIVGTVTIYGLSASPLGRWLGVAQPNPQGVMIAGGHPWGRAIGAALKSEGFEVLLVDTNRENINAARMVGLQTIYANILSDYIIDDIEMGSIGRLLALTPNNEVNALAVLHFTEIFGRAGVYQLPPAEVPKKRKKEMAQPLRGRYLFSRTANFTHLSNMFEQGAEIKATSLTAQFTFADFQEVHGQQALPLFLKDQLGNLIIYTSASQLLPQPGQTIISMAYPTAPSGPVAVPETHPLREIRD